MIDKIQFGLIKMKITKRRIYKEKIIHTNLIQLRMSQLKFLMKMIKTLKIRRKFILMNQRT